MLILKLHHKDNRVIVAVCDKELIGRKFDEGKKQLDLTSAFYQGEEKTSLEAGDIVRNADIVHLVGEEAIKLGLEEGVIETDHVLTIDGIPHAQSVLEE